MSGKVWRAVYAPTSNSASRANKPPRQLSAALIRLNRPALAFLWLANHHRCRPECISRVTRPVAQRFLAQALQLLVHLVAVMPERLIRRPEMGSVNDGTSRYPHLLPQSRLRAATDLLLPSSVLSFPRRARPASHAVGTQPSASGEQPWH